MDRYFGLISPGPQRPSLLYEQVSGLIGRILIPLQYKGCDHADTRVVPLECLARPDEITAAADTTPESFC
ncbi:hypothetical protein KEM63_01410 [Halopseudomonas nanhaiensis]|uniref:hypothetical protein n=1 Tax=Halopseudomonas nanhaiensis TaxID=2830842 RepID=UPI001CBAD8D0|nr:hypothetical protein [Halopseudomonas nanhaiensis]UAW98671.1 hypothetical protein KEM63_01410 [Halopseudomonas nanhaiensis]